MKNLVRLISIFIILGNSSIDGSYAQTNSINENKKNTEAENTINNLAQPYETKSAINFSKVIGWETNATPKAPDGFSVTKFAGDLQYPRWIYVLPNGDVLVAEAKKEEKGIMKVAADITGISKTHGESSNMNRILLFRDTNKDGKPDIQEVFLKEQSLPFGMVLLKNFFYLANTDALWRFPYKEGQTSITVKGEKIFEYPAEGRHWTKNIIANREGTKIYIAVGSASDHAENGIEKEDHRACIIEINPDGSGEKIYASGLRNPVGMAWFPGTNVMWTAVNERDGLGDDVPPDYLTSVKEGGFYGWPYSYFGQHEDPRIKEEDKRPDLVAKAIVPDVPLGTHTASLGLAFYESKMLPEKYRNGAFVGQHGSWNRKTPSGNKVIFVPFKDGKAGEPEDFLTGFIADEKKYDVYGRPVGVAVMKDGSILIADDAGNAVWRVSYGK